MSAANQTPAADDAAAPVASRRLIADLRDPEGPPCVLQTDAEGQVINIIDEFDDDYEAEVALAEKEERDARKEIRDNIIRSNYVRGLLAEASAAAAAGAAENRPAARFRPKVPDLNAPRPNWLVKNLVPERGQVMIFGRHGTGKSTLAVDMGVAVALGRPWHGRKTLLGTVVYIASEDTHGFRARLDARLRDLGITLDDLGGRFLELTGRPHLLKPDEVTALIAELKPLGPTLVVVDTMARAAAGADENSAQEMGMMIENCQTIINQTGATVLLLHHTGKDSSKGARGSSAIPGAVDAEIFLERPKEEENLRIAHVGKMRGGRDYYTLFRYSLETIQLGVDEDGDKITSTVVRELPPDPEVQAKTTKKKPSSPTRCAIRAVLGNAGRAMPFEEMIAAVIPKLVPSTPGSEDNRRTRIRQTSERMVHDKEMQIDANGMVSLIDPAMPFTPVVAASAADPMSEGVQL